MTEQSEDPERLNGTSSNELVSAKTAMPLDPARGSQLITNLSTAIQQVASASASQRLPRLVLVSKLHPTADILHLHSEAHKHLKQPDAYSHFGENYVQELQHKASVLPRTIKWHFIGGLQSNKAKPLASSIPNLWCVSSVDSLKKADALEKGRAALEEQNKNEIVQALNVHIQVNTSGEESKSGVPPTEAAALCQHVREQCPRLKLLGLMTIGAIARSKPSTAGNSSENEDYETLKQTREQVTNELGLSVGDLELSMGMSGDFEEAIKQGSDEVRLGSTIFGSRPATGSLSIEEIEHRSKNDH
ncbi:MAG: hypothetical protein M1828_003319 [Chrysothrix sp. TS-e1954]|nr:MAG: hypothetical protein M1828_003319 [Chrysothrix sp. TS-e1954]